MTRIIAGIAGGRTIQVPPRGTRPTSDRVREALFTRLDSYDLLEDARVLDLYAGSGALGLEAASRGAATIDLVEHDRRAAQVCRDNARTLAIPDVPVRVHQAKVESYLAGHAPSDEAQRWTLAFVDPPYDLATERLEAALGLLVEHLGHDAVVVVERSSRSEPLHLPDGLATWQDRKYGETTLHFLDRV